MQPVLVDMKGVDGKGDITACHFFVLRPGQCSGRVLAALEQDLSPVDLRIRVDVGPHCFRLEPLVIATHAIDVGLDLVLSRLDLRLVSLDLGDIDVVLLLVGADLELLQHQILRDLGGLRSEVGYLIGGDGSRRHDHRYGDRGYERQAHRPHSNTDEPSHSASETWLRCRVLLDPSHDWRNVYSSCLDRATGMWLASANPYFGGTGFPVLHCSRCA
jgi:hypothetical protein